MEKATTPLTPKDLTSRLGLTEKRVRALLRKSYSREAKGKRWEITPELAKRIVKDYKAKEKAKEAVKKEQIKKELAGEADIGTSREDNSTQKGGA